MSNREMLYRAVLMQGGSVTAESPHLPTRELSPMSSLAFNLHHTASLTPRRKLSLNSTISSDSPLSNQDSPSLSISMNDGTNINYMEDSSFLSPPSNTLMSPPSTTTTILSPSRKMLARNKENFPSPYFSPSHSAHIPRRQRTSPLKDVQNTVRNLTFSPMKKNLQVISPHKRALSSPHKPLSPDDFDTTSQDSGYSESGKKLEDSCFSVPVSVAPRKLNLDTPPKVQTVTSPDAVLAHTTTSTSTVSSTANSSGAADERKPFRKFSSLSNEDQEDAVLMDLMNESPQEDHPFGFASLLSAPIHKAQKSPIFSSTSANRPGIKRCLSMVDITPTSSRVESVLNFTNAKATNVIYGSFKRPEAPTDLSSECKKRKEDYCRGLSPLQSNASTSVYTVGASPLTQRQVSAPETSSTSKPKIVRSHSESHVSIMKALNKCSNHNGELTGDFSKPIALPTIEGGKHPDLKAISVDTMAELVRGEYSSQISSYRVIDCRYPYEFEGGHIHGAEMFHHPQMIIDHLMAQKGAPVITKEGTPRNILIFHCEYSAERGPKAQRLLRENDRTTNKEHYPALHFPETYLLEGGYKAFFEKYPELCTPRSYVRMLDSNHSEDLKHFRGKSKSWQAENKQSKTRTALPRAGLKRLGL